MSNGCASRVDGAVPAWNWQTGGAGAWPALIERWGKAVKSRQRVAKLQKPHFTGAALARYLD
ncbi:MAG: hypothetical protein KDI17_04010 [Halioglobus sp.]|nr:hypothetical protein [Halioglobus sp.]